jgi:hypothetical protein
MIYIIQNHQDVPAGIYGDLLKTARIPFQTIRADRGVYIDESGTCSLCGVGRCHFCSCVMVSNNYRGNAPKNYKTNQLRQPVDYSGCGYLLNMGP